MSNTTLAKNPSLREAVKCQARRMFAARLAGLRGGGEPDVVGVFAWENPEEIHPFSPSELIDMAGTADPEAFAVTIARGDSMFPDICDGDELLVDIRVKKPVDGGVYIIPTWSGDKLKRVKFDQDSGLIEVKGINEPEEARSIVKPEYFDRVGLRHVLKISRKMDRDT